jgi:hypothetical protein
VPSTVSLGFPCIGHLRMGAGRLNSLPLFPKSGSRAAVIRAYEVDTCLFECVLNCFDGACLQHGPIFEPRHRLRRHASHFREFSLAPSKNRARHPTLNRENCSHDARPHFSPEISHDRLTRCDGFVSIA